MANNLVFNNVASKLLVLINGQDSNGNTQPILIDDNGVIQLSTVTVTAEDLDIRNLSGTTDSVLIANPVVTVTAQDLDIRNLSGTTDSVLIANSVVTITAQDLNIRNLSGTTDSVLIANPVVTVTAQDLDIRNLSGTTDSVLIANPVVTVTAQDLDIRNLSGTTDSVLIANTVITLTAENLDIRNLSGVTDSVSIIGLLTTSETNVTTGTTGGVLPQDTSLISEFSYYVSNNSADTLTAIIELSPNSTPSYFIPDPNQAATIIPPASKAILISSLYSKYARLYYTSPTTANFEAYYTARS